MRVGRGSWRKSISIFVLMFSRYSEPETVIMLVGNKSDLESQVTDKMVEVCFFLLHCLALIHENYMEDNSLMMTYLKTSAQSSAGVNELFLTLIGEMMEKHNADGWKNS
jgi:GTPase SAR1 family protein